ncbi:SRPBCC family protein [Streptomyces blattellae]|uniref:SRPBCC family protein n=1 Tax=Streptomyces blattellae TaxID=2569855 RepID=UPI0012BA026E|nr:SRPBCC family protein [Streptomyces blattellae]
MADTKAAGRGTTAGGLTNPGANRLVEELGTYAEARIERMLTGAGHKMGDAAARLGSAHAGPRDLARAVGKGGRSLGGHLGREAVSHAKDTAKETATHAKDTLVDKVKDVAGKKHGAPSPDGGPKSISIIEDIDVGVPVREAYDQWTQFTEFSRFTKGVVDVEQEDDTTTQWQVKIAKANRAWKGTITEQVPDERIAWTSEGAKGTTKGVVTFHPLADNLTKVLLVLDYYPKGVIEKAGSLVRAQGRRTRLDLKLYRKFVMLRGEATGDWRGEIREGEVVRGPDEEDEEERPDEEYEDEEDEEDEDEEEEEDENTDEDEGEDLSQETRSSTP